ncbi:MAG: trimethylamine methyltransferase family protein [Gammaproteobacteria bacterium]|nr:trimethylamine methyltransferase family protein [Gammaproteobacteria bacterium]
MAPPRSPSRKRKRAGGRDARRELRAASTSGQAVQPGQAGGSYRPLSARDMERINDTALNILENIGIADPIPEILHYALPGGCVLGEDGRLRFPRALVEDLADVNAKSYVAFAPDPDFDIEVSGDRVYFTTSGESVSILDHETRSFRPTRLVDLYDAARLADTLEHIHQFGQPFIAAEHSEDVFVHDINIAYAELAGTRKAFALGIAEVDHVEPIIALFDEYLGGEGEFLKRPFCTFGGCPIVSPLRFGADNARVLVRLAELGLTGDVAVAPQAGATSPAALAGTLAQTFAETLACMAVTNLVRPGSAINFGMWPFISDLRTGAFSGGSGEEALVMAASAQLCNHYGFITSMASGMTDSKVMDAQAGFEKAVTTTALALAGGNLVAAYPGIVGSLLGQSFEGMVIDNDMLGNVQRLLRGIEVTEETLSYGVIEETVMGAGHYLGHPQTLELMQSEYLYPGISDRRTAGEWEVTGRQDIVELARDRVRQILSSHYPETISASADQRIRDRFPIRLDPADMRAGNGRW